MRLSVSKGPPNSGDKQLAIGKGMKGEIQEREEKIGKLKEPRQDLGGLKIKQKRGK